jgi:hypothetical protein
VAIRRVRTACWIPKAADTHLEYTTRIAFPLLQRLRDRDLCNVDTYSGRLSFSVSLRCFVTGKISSQLPVPTHLPTRHLRGMAYVVFSKQLIFGWGVTERKKFQFPPRESIPRYAVFLLNSREVLNPYRTFIGHDVTPRNIVRFITLSLLFFLLQSATTCTRFWLVQPLSSIRLYSVLLSFNCVSSYSLYLPKHHLPNVL